MRKKLFIIFALIGLSLSVAKRVQLTLDVAHQVFDSTLADRIVGIAQTKGHAFALTRHGKIHARTVATATAIDVKDIRPEILETNPSLNFRGVMDCFQGKEVCIVCGRKGGCVGYTWLTGTSPIWNGFFFHRYFEYKNGLDHVYKVHTLYNTMYFFTVEGMQGAKSAGLVRYDISTANCWVNYSPKWLNSEGTNPEYDIAEGLFTRKLFISHVQSRHVLIMDYSNLQSPLYNWKVPVTIGMGKIASTSAVISENGFIMCQRNSASLCTIHRYEAAGVKTMGAFKQENGIESPVPTNLDVVSIPSAVYFYVAFGRTLLLYKQTVFPATAPATIPAAIGEESWFRHTTNIMHIYDRENSKNLMVADNYKVYFTKITKVVAADPLPCHPTCGTGAVCTAGLYRRPDCNPGTACATPSVVTNWVSSETLCKVVGTATAILPKGNGITSPAVAGFKSDGKYCTNTTLLRAPTVPAGQTQ